VDIASKLRRGSLMSFNSKRRSQLVVPFGVGAMVDFKDETWMTAGLNFWPSESDIHRSNKNEIVDATQIVDKRLQDRLTILLERQKNPIKYFLQPTITGNPHGRRKPENADMPFVRFPKWHFCSNCKSMKEFPLTRRKLPRCERTEKGKPCRGQFSPLRFLIVCPHGHISDFPWQNWVGKGKPCCEKSRSELSFTTNSSPGLDGVIIKCKGCSEKRSMTGSMGNSQALRDVLSGGHCPGEKPWLLEEDADNCLQVPTTVQRGASNTYFGNTESSILIPPYSKSVRQLLDRPLISKQIIKFFEKNTVDQLDGISRFNETRLREDLELLRDVDSKLENMSMDIIMETARLKYSEDKNELFSSSINEISYRKKEYEAYLGVRPAFDDRNDFDILNQPITNYSPFIQSIFSHVILVPSLRETRVLTGFSRLIPGNSGSEGVFLHKKDEIPEWLPALEVRGEGIFLKFNEQTINKWLEEADVSLETKTSYRENWIQQAIVDGSPNFTRSDTATTTLIAIHTFSHLLMKHLIFRCGYDSSSLRERLYVSNEPDSLMSGLLIYTASGDSQGTLGGLVSQGLPENLDANVRGALAYDICSNDPICIETEKQGIQGLNGAACHSCCLLPETSCEHSNTLLDRTYLFGPWGTDENGLSKWFDK